MHSAKFVQTYKVHSVNLQKFVFCTKKPFKNLSFGTMHKMKNFVTVYINSFLFWCMYWRSNVGNLSCLCLTCYSHSVPYACNMASCFRTLVPSIKTIETECPHPCSQKDSVEALLLVTGDLR